MNIFRIFKSLINIAKAPSPNYPKGMNSNVDVLSELVEIGEGFISAPGSAILSHDASTITHTGKSRIEKTIVGKDVFLGYNAVILPGIKIGDGAIIGAGAVVTKDVEAYTVVGGNPAKKITTVDEYMKKCESRNVLYDLTEDVLKKHGTGVRATKEETNNLISKIYVDYKSRNNG